ncbi:MAG: hypothetical protein AB7K09_09245 [Planctomycetota bacterium]
MMRTTRHRRRDGLPRWIVPVVIAATVFGLYLATDLHAWRVAENATAVWLARLTGADVVVDNGHAPAVIGVADTYATTAQCLTPEFLAVALPTVFLFRHSLVGCLALLAISRVFNVVRMAINISIAEAWGAGWFATVHECTYWISMPGLVISMIMLARLAPARPPTTDS